MNSSLRILCLIEAAGGGAGKHVAQLCKTLSEQGHNVHLLYSPLREDKLFAEEIAAIAQITCAPLPIPRALSLKDFSAIAKVRHYITEHGPFDIAHAHGSKAGAILRLACIGLRCPACVYTPHGFATTNSEFGKRKRQLFSFIEYALSYFSRAIITVSRHEMKHATEDLRISPKKIHLIHNGMPQVSYPERGKIRSELNIPADALCVGFVGMFYRDKGADIFVHAARKILDATPHTAIVVAGSGPMQQEIDAIADTLQLTNRIIWIQNRRGVDIIPAFDVMVIPSRKESMPYVMLEALQAGLPLVATTAGEMPNILQEGENACIVPIEQPGIIADRVLKLLSAPEKRAIMSANNRRLAEDFTLEKMVSQTLNLYRGLLT